MLHRLHFCGKKSASQFTEELRCFSAAHRPLFLTTENATAKTVTAFRSQANYSITIHSTKCVMQLRTVCRCLLSGLMRISPSCSQGVSQP